MNYSYICKENHEVTLSRKVADRDKPVICKECKRMMKRKLEAPSLKFHGTGFYTTDYKNK